MWTAYQVVLRLQSPMHIGAGKVGNLQRTRSYITGRNLWGALTERLTRDGNGKNYGDVGKAVHEGLVFTYFYPTTNTKGSVTLWPWDDPARFRYLYLSSETSTALDPATGSAEEASLHEIECILPYTREGAPVYLIGYIFQHESFNLDWQDALTRLQIGGERGYGWGRVEDSVVKMIDADQIDLFHLGHVAYLGGPWVRVLLHAGARIPVHALAAPFGDRPPVPQSVTDGSVEPLVGRETTPKGRFGVQISDARICYVPGAWVKTDVPEEKRSAQIGHFGVWQGLT